MRKLLLALTALLLCTGSMLAQAQKVITGTVKDETGNALPGVSIQVKGTSTGTVSDETGNFTLNLPSNAQSLVLRLVGMQDKEIAIGTNTNFTITMSASVSNLDEFVIMGYGSGKKVGSVVGSFTKVSGKTLQNRPTANSFDAMQGRVAGLQVFTSSGEPSQTSSIRLHGVGSLGASSTPLIIMDGTPVESASILSMNPQDFESITVLKDASATSIYGSRAANGVIVITTKKGSLRQNVISLQSQYGVSNMIDNSYFNNFMNSKELTDFWVATGYRRRGQVDTLLRDFPNNTRWDKVYYKENVPTYQADLSVSGGGGKTTYYVSGGYLHQEGLAYRSNYDRYSLRSNLNTTVTNWLRFGVNLSGAYDKRQTNPYGSNSTNRGLALLAPPFYSLYDANGVEYPDLIPGWARYNPKYLAEKVTSDLNKVLVNLSGYMEITPIENVTIKTQAAIEASDLRAFNVQMPSHLASPGNGNSSEELERRVNRTITNTIEYRFKVGSDHSFTALVGQEYLDNKYDGFSASSTGQTDDRLTMISSGPNNRAVGSFRQEYAYLSYFGRLEYNWLSKYFVDLSLRQDQSSRFGKDNRTANFWSVGAMWKMKEENFLRDVHWVNYLDVKVSHGTSGNSFFGTANDNYLHLALVGSNSYEQTAGWGLAAPGNPLLSWESQANTSVSAVFGLFDKARFDLTFYNRSTKNMLVDVPYPFTSGFSTIKTNVGSLRNRGIDVDISVDVYKSKKAYITPRVNFNYNQNKVTELFQDKQYWIIPNTGVSWAVGQPISFFYPVFARVNPESGSPEWYLPNENPDEIVNTRKDINHVTSTFNAANLQQSTGINRYPPFNGGFGVDAGYEGFFLQADFTFSKGKYLINNDRYFFENPNQFQGFNQSKVILDYWKKPGDVTRFPRYGVQFTQFDSRLIEDASFLRLKGLTIGYNFKQGLLKQKANFFKGATLFVTGRNLLTFTKYTGPDPEVDSNLTLGVNPNTKQYAVGLSIQL